MFLVTVRETACHATMEMQTPAVTACAIMDTSRKITVASPATLSAGPAGVSWTVRSVLTAMHSQGSLGANAGMGTGPVARLPTMARVSSAMRTVRLVEKSMCALLARIQIPILLM